MYLLGPDSHTKIEHDGYHLFVRRDGRRVRLFNERVQFYAFDCPCSAAVGSLSFMRPLAEGLSGASRRLASSCISATKPASLLSWSTAIVLVGLTAPSAARADTSKRPSRVIVRTSCGVDMEGLGFGGSQAYHPANETA